MTYNEAVMELLGTPGLGFSISVDPRTDKQLDAAKEFINKFLNQTGFRMSGYLSGLFKRDIPFKFYNSGDKYLYGTTYEHTYRSVNILDVKINKTDENDFMELIG